METVIENEEMEQYAEFKRKLNADAARAQAGKMELDYCDPAADKNILKRICNDCNLFGIGAICVLPNCVKPCVNFLGNDPQTSLITCISYPNGADTTDIKVKALKRAVKDGVDEVEVTAPISYIKDGNWSYIKKEFKKLKKAVKERALRVNVESPLLSEQELIKVCRLAADCGITSLRIKSDAFSSGFDAQGLKTAKEAVKDKCTLKADGIISVTEMNQASNLGAGIIGSKNAIDLARIIQRD